MRRRLFPADAGANPSRRRKVEVKVECESGPDIFHVCPGARLRDYSMNRAVLLTERKQLGVSDTRFTSQCSFIKGGRPPVLQPDATARVELTLASQYINTVHPMLYNVSTISDRGTFIQNIGSV